MSPPPPPQSPPFLLHKTPNSLSDFIFSAFSLFILFSPPTKPISKFHLNLNPNRRFSKFPLIMSSLTPTTQKKHQFFATPQSLSDWLRPRLPSDSFASWGTKPGTKNIHNLWLELSEGETSLQDSTPPIRTVQVVIVRVLDKQNRLLIESHQELSNGDVRNRCRPLSEKMKPNETVESAVVRAVREELGSIIGDCCSSNFSNVVRIVPNSYNSKVEERLSVSYPGLPACYMLHSVDAWVEGLPEDEFCTVEEEEYEDSDEKKVAGGAVSCKKHYWKWVDNSESSYC